MRWTLAGGTLAVLLPTLATVLGTYGLGLLLSLIVTSNIGATLTIGQPIFKAPMTLGALMWDGSVRTGGDLSTYASASGYLTLPTLTLPLIATVTVTTRIAERQWRSAGVRRQCLSVPSRVLS